MVFKAKKIATHKKIASIIKIEGIVIYDSGFDKKATFHHIIIMTKVNNI